MLFFIQRLRIFLQSYLVAFSLSFLFLREHLSRKKGFYNNMTTFHFEFAAALDRFMLFERADVSKKQTLREKKPPDHEAVLRTLQMKAIALANPAKVKKKVDQSTGLFDKMKQQVLHELSPGPGEKDLSPKGFVDERCRPLMQTLNQHEDYVTTSSCSGRVALWCGNEKGDGGWLLSSHEEVTVEDVLAALMPFPTAGSVVFKMEPFLMHVMCRNLEAAHRLLVAVLHAGYRNSGVIPGKKRTMLGIRHTMTLEVPIGEGGQCMLEDDRYLRYITKVANAKLRENFQRMEVLHKAVVGALESSGGSQG